MAATMILGGVMGNGKIFFQAWKPCKHLSLIRKNVSVSSSSTWSNDTNLINSSPAPIEHSDYFGVRNFFNIKDLFQNRIHLGHKSILRNVHMRPYLFGCRLGVDIMDLNQTDALLTEALNFTAHIAYRKGVILLLTRSPQNVPYIEKVALDCGEYSHCRKWRLGTFTNSIVQYEDMTRLPDLCIFLSTLDDAFEQHAAVVEAAKMNIPTIGIVDSNSDPRLITYPIPGNDDSPVSVQFFGNLFAKAVLKGKEANRACGIETTV